MSNGSIPSLGSTNVLAEKAGRAEQGSLTTQSWTVYKPTAPDYSNNKRIERRADPQPDRVLPGRHQQMQEPIRNVRSSQREVNIPNSSQVRIIRTYIDSGLGPVIDAISGSVTEDYSKPAPKKPIHQRNKIR